MAYGETELARFTQLNQKNRLSDAEADEQKRLAVAHAQWAAETPEGQAWVAQTMKTPEYGRSRERMESVDPVSGFLRSLGPGGENALFGENLQEKRAREAKERLAQAQQQQQRTLFEQQKALFEIQAPRRIRRGREELYARGLGSEPDTSLGGTLMGDIRRDIEMGRARLVQQGNVQGASDLDFYYKLRQSERQAEQKTFNDILSTAGFAAAMLAPETLGFLSVGGAGAGRAAEKLWS